MSTTRPPAKVKLVTVFIPHERSERFAEALHAIGVHAYSSMRSDGMGRHGPRVAGFFDPANIRYEVLTDAATAARIFALVERNYADEAVVAYALDVEAVPAAKFGG